MCTYIVLDIKSFTANDENISKQNYWAVYINFTKQFFNAVFSAIVNVFTIP